MSCDDCLSRREFFARAAFASAVFAALEGCGDGQIGFTGTNVGAGLTIKVADFPGLANVGTLVDVGNFRAAIRLGPSTFAAFSRACSHEGFITDIRNNRFECALHGSIFANDGSVIRGPSTGERISGLTKLPATFDAAAGTLTIA